MTVMAMKYKCWMWTLLAVFALLSTPVFSTDLTINFNGQFVVPTCSFTVNGGNSVNLGTYPNTYFNTNTSTPIVGILIAATGCTTGINTIHLNFSGTADSSNNQLFATNNGSGVNGVAVELLAPSTQTRITPGSSVDWTGVNPSLSTNTYSPMTRFYKTTGAVTAGTINVPITINFTYN
jgi:minor fimbrial subunit